MRAVVAVLFLVTAVHAGLWALLQDKKAAPDFHGMLPSLSYAPFEPGHTVADIDADSEKVRADLRKLSTIARAVRLYSSTEGNELVPPIAAEFGMKGGYKNENCDDGAHRDQTMWGSICSNEPVPWVRPTSRHS